MIRVTLAQSIVAATFLVFVATAPETFGAKTAPDASTARAEIQITLCSPPEQIQRALHLRPHGAPLEVWLFDNDAFVLFERGLRLRLRVAENRAELTLKVANQDCAKWASLPVPPGEGKCEYDLHGTDMAGAVSLNRNVDAATARDLLAGRLPLAEALSAAQSGYLRQVAPGRSLPADIRAFGPQRVVNYRSKGKPYDVTVSSLPGGESYVEIARKVALADATRKRASLVDELLSAKVAICTDQSAQAIDKLRSLQRSP